MSLAIGSSSTTERGDFATTAVRPSRAAAVNDVNDVNDVDLLDPDSMMAFFALQMSDVKQKLGAAMQGQQKRNDCIKTLASLQADLAAFKSKGVGPGDPQWPAFQAKVEQARTMLGPSMEGTAIDATMEKTASKNVSQTFDPKDTEGIKKFYAEHPDAKAVSGGDSLTLSASNGKRLDSDDVDKLIGQIKGYSESLTSENGLNMIRVQQLVESSSQLMNLCSNIMKKISDSAMAPINNMR